MTRNEVRALEEGLSPRVRGNPLDALSARSRCGTIPACAGEPQLGGLRRARRRDYPRVCGGTVLNLGGHKRFEGLSPRVRGNPASRDWRDAY